MDTVKFWDSHAASYAKSTIDDMDAYEYGLERTRSYLRDTDSVLELGCGTGTTALLLADAVADYLATDIAPKMVEIGAQKAAEQGAAGLRFAAGTVEEVTAGASGLDAALAFNLLHLLPNLEADLAAVHAALKPGGLFISKTFFVPERGESLKSRLIRTILPVMQWVGKAPYVRFYRGGELERLIGAAGFELLETGSYPADRRFIVARKI